MAKVVEVYPDKSCNVRNVQVLVRPNQDGTNKYKPYHGYELKRYVSKLLHLVSAEDQDEVVLEDDFEVKSTILDEDDVCDAMAPRVSSSCNSPDVQK